MHQYKFGLNALTKIGITMHVAKTALAAGISYTLALTMSNNPYPIFAPLAAILTIQITIADSMQKGLYRTLGVIIGVALGDLITHFLSISAFSIFIGLLLAFAVSTALQLNQQIISQIGVSVLLVMGYGQENGYMIGRIIETILGAASAIVINIFLQPLDPFILIKQAILKLSNKMSRALLNMGSCQAPHNLSQQLQQSRELVKQTERELENFLGLLNSLRFSPFHKSNNEQLQHLIEVVNKIERLSIQVRGIARSLHDLKVQRHQDYDFTPVLRETALCIKLFGENKAHPTEQSFRQLQDLLAAARVNQRNTYSQLQSHNSEDFLPEIGSLFTDLTRILDEIEN
ncbi:MAG TPA: FUSC family protein [Candidatus Avacidaminococcus intestinavium]|uniref:FUSC family protein n=1 Tax=Candidatus Avacidaminococcus intestinavium TaxID=2840684 RepID=A0A9D1MNB7_9FIRM|nr:FUSC family protein [Candidatus Avacidaminococcus intestinavium]